MPVLATAARVVKCPTGHCPGWLTVDDARPQTVPCRYCRVTVNTLSYLLENTSDPAAGRAHAMPPAVHEAFNGLLLTVAGMTGGNVYLRPIDRTIVSLLPSTRGVIIEYNPVIARQAGPAAVAAMILHYLLHIEQHPRSEKPLGLVVKPGGRDREALQPAANSLPTLADHAWIAPRIAEIDPGLLLAARAWGLPAAEMLTGNETFFPVYMAERNRRWIMEQFAAPEANPDEVSARLLERLASLSARFFAGHREDLRRAVVALQLADFGLRDPQRVDTYRASLEAAGLPNVEASANIAEHLVADLGDVRAESPTQDPASFRRALEAGLKALNMQAGFEVQALKHSA